MNTPLRVSFPWSMLKTVGEPIKTKVQVKFEAKDAMSLRNVLCRLLKCDCVQPIRFDWKIGPVTSKQQLTKDNHMDINISNEEKVLVTLAPVTDTGKPAKLDGAPVWSTQSGDSTLIVADGGLSAELVSSDTPGDTVFLVEADANLGEGVETISDTIRLTVTGASAKNLGLLVGTPSSK